MRHRPGALTLHTVYDRQLEVLYPRVYKSEWDALLRRFPNIERLVKTIQKCLQERKAA